jgi:AhpC/TSA family
MVNRGRRALIQVLLGAALAACPVVALPSLGAAVEEGSSAPDFKLPATTGLDIALSDFKGKRWVLLEFYGADFSPT